MERKRTKKNPSLLSCNYDTLDTGDFQVVSLFQASRELHSFEDLRIAGHLIQPVTSHHLILLGQDRVEIS